MLYKSAINIVDREISLAAPTYFIADIASNHDGEIERAKDLIYKAKEAGADAAKFQHFLAKDLVSASGFNNLGSIMEHQRKWKKSTYEIYEQYECSREWTEILVNTCKEAGIDFMTTPYDYEAIHKMEKHIVAYKIGSGDITCTGEIECIAKKNKPVFLATGASSMQDVERAVSCILEHNPELVLMQCNTNYTSKKENFAYINLRALEVFKIKWPNMLLGLSDHTPGHATVLGAVTLGARVIEKHFTDDNSRTGPDHLFSMSPITWRDMVDRTRELEYSLGDGIKKIEANEINTVILQRRSMHVNKTLKAGSCVTIADIDFLRPAPAGSIPPYEIDKIIGRNLLVDKEDGDTLFYADLSDL